MVAVSIIFCSSTNGYAFSGNVWPCLYYCSGDKSFIYNNISPRINDSNPWFAYFSDIARRPIFTAGSNFFLSVIDS